MKMFPLMYGGLGRIVILIKTRCNKYHNVFTQLEGHFSFECTSAKTNQNQIIQVHLVISWPDLDKNSMVYEYLKYFPRALSRTFYWVFRDHSLLGKLENTVHTFNRETATEMALPGAWRALLWTYSIKMKTDEHVQERWHHNSMPSFFAQVIKRKTTLNPVNGVTCMYSKDTTFGRRGTGSTSAETWEIKSYKCRTLFAS